MSDRLFRGRRKPALFGLCVGAAAVCVLFAVFDGRLGWGVYPGLVLFGVATIGWGGLYATMAGELGGKKQAGLAAGLCSAVVNLGIVVGPPAFGYLVDATGSCRASWILMAACAGTAVLTVSLVHEPRTRPGCPVCRSLWRGEVRRSQSTLSPAASPSRESQR